MLTTPRAWRRGAPGPERVGLRQVLRAEWTKVRTLRATIWAAAVIVPLVVGLAVFVGLTKSLQPDDTVLGGSLTGAVPGQLAAAIFGVLAVSGEYGTGMIRVTFTAVPRRGLVLAAKALVVGAVTCVAALVGCAAGYGIGRVLLDGGGYAAGDPWPALFGVTLCITATAVLGVAAGLLLRRSAGAVTAVIAFLMLPTLVGPLFGDLERWVSGAGPQTVLLKLTQSSDVTAASAGSLGGWPSLALVCGYTAALLGVAAARVARRDA